MTLNSTLLFCVQKVASIFDIPVLFIYFSEYLKRRDEVMGEWRRLLNEEVNDLYSSPNIVQVIKSRRMRWAGHVARMGEERGGLLTPWCRVLLEKLTGLQLVKKLPAFHGTRRFITALTSVRHLSLSWASPTQSIYPHPTSEEVDSLFS